MSKEEQILLDSYRIWGHLLLGEFEKAEALFDHYPFELFNQESTLLHPLYGCWLLAIESEEIAKIHLAGVIETPFPRSWALLGHEITYHLLQSPEWFDQSFHYERRQLYLQLALWHSCAQNPKEAARFHLLATQG